MGKDCWPATTNTMKQLKTVSKGWVYSFIVWKVLDKHTYDFPELLHVKNMVLGSKHLQWMNEKTLKNIHGTTKTTNGSITEQCVREHNHCSWLWFAEGKNYLFIGVMCVSVLWFYYCIYYFDCFGLQAEYWRDLGQIYCTTLFSKCLDSPVICNFKVWLF